MKKIKNILQFITVMLLMTAILTANSALISFAATQDNQQTNNSQLQTRLLAQTGQEQTTSSYMYLPDAKNYGDVPSPPKANAQTQFASLTWTLFQNVKYIIGAVAILMIVIAGVRMVLGWGNEETYSTQRKNIFYGIIGLLTIGVANELASTFQVTCPPPVAGQPQSACIVGGFLKNPNAIVRTSALFDQTTQIIIIFIKYFAGGITLIMIGRNILRFVSMGSDEEKIPYHIETA